MVIIFQQRVNINDKNFEYGCHFWCSSIIIIDEYFHQAHSSFCLKSSIIMLEICDCVAKVWGR